MSVQTITAITSLIVGLATLATAIAAVIKAFEAQHAAEVTSVKVDAHQAVTTAQLEVVQKQTNGILSQLPPIVAANSAAIDDLKKEQSQ
jgi:hypothetical protein